MRCGWDPAKYQEVFTRRGLRLELAELAFDDPNAIEIEDYLDNNNEQRYQLIGMVDGVLIVVAYVYRDAEGDGEEIPWVITLRKAVSYEETQYNYRRS